MRALILAFAAASLVAQTNPLANSRDAIEAGKGMFRIYCSPCHGLGAQGGRAPDLTTGNFSAGPTDAALFAVVSGGIAGTEMPAYSSRFDADGIWRILAYLRSIGGKAQPPPNGDPAKGETLYWGKAGCGGCHRIGARGGRLGPELSAIGRMRSLAYLREALVEPGARLTPGYETLTVQTRDGRTITGVQKNYDAFSAALMDSSERYHAFLTEEVRSVKRETRSLMPPTRLPDPGLDHLLAYLVSLRGAPK
ncbi:MAG: c-type cytochrome [Bryobacteraceae bacterium]